MLLSKKDCKHDFDGELFKNESFFYIPPKNSVDRNDCVPHALNYYGEGPIFKHRQNFFEIYIARKKSGYKAMVEDVVLRGISLVNLHDILYYPQRDVFLTPLLVGTV